MDVVVMCELCAICAVLVVLVVQVARAINRAERGVATGTRAYLSRRRMSSTLRAFPSSIHHGFHALNAPCTWGRLVATMRTHEGSLANLFACVRVCVCACVRACVCMCVWGVPRSTGGGIGDVGRCKG